MGHVREQSERSVRLNRRQVPEPVRQTPHRNDAIQHPYEYRQRNGSPKTGRRSFTRTRAARRRRRIGFCMDNLRREGFEMMALPSETIQSSPPRRSWP